MRRSLICILLCCVTLLSYGQKGQDQSILLYTAMQKYADTTFMVQIQRQGVVNGIDYYILSKKDTLINIYYYGDLTKGIKMPKEISIKLKGLALIDTNKANINMRFSPQPIKKSDAGKFWNQVLTLKPLQIDDNEAQQYCPDSKIKLFDGGSASLVVITRTEIKKLTFYSPEFYEEKCPGNINRQAIIKIKNLFENYFGFWN